MCIQETDSDSKGDLTAIHVNILRTDLQLCSRQISLQNLWRKKKSLTFWGYYKQVNDQDRCKKKISPITC